MGFVSSKFRKEKSSSDMLEGLQAQIEDLEEYVINTQECKRRFVGNFIAFTLGVYAIGFALWYFFYFPTRIQDRIMYMVPLLISLVLIVFLRQVFTWYFQRKLNKNGKKLTQLKEQKNKILEQVIEKETYKVAVSLLERFGDKQQNRLLQSRAQPGKPLSGPTTSSLPWTPQMAAPHPQLLQQLLIQTPFSVPYRHMHSNHNCSLVNTTLQMTPATLTMHRRTPFPVIDAGSRSAVDRILDFILGDGPQNRFGMICKQCHRHNGMLPLGEYEYTAFHCAYCNTLNPARKERRVSPRLSLLTFPQLVMLKSSLQLRNDSSDIESSDDRSLQSECSKSEADSQTDANLVDETVMELSQGTKANNSSW